MRTWRAAGVGALLAPLLLAGCAEPTFIYNDRISTGYSPTEFGVGAGRKDLRTVVLGDPFGIGQERFAAATVDVLNRYGTPLQPTNFVTEPGQNANPLYRVVLVFGAPGTPTFRLCQDPPPAARREAEDGALHVAAAFCRRAGELSMVEGRVAAVEGVDDPKFEALLGQVLQALFPPRDPTEDDDEPIFLPDD